MNKRWYDKLDKSADVMEKLQKMDKEALNRVAQNLNVIASSIKAIKRDQEEQALSIGIDRVKGLYQQNKNRRWYDKNAELSIAMRSISTLSDDEYSGIIEALDVAIVE